MYFAIKDLLRAISHFFNDLKDINIILANRLSELYFRCSRGQYVSPSSRGQELFPHVSGMAYLALIAQPGTNSFAYLRGVSCFVGGE